MDDYFAALELRQGFIGRRDVLAAGGDDRFIQRQLQSRAWTRIRNGAYTYTPVWAALDPEEKHRRLSRAVLRAHGGAVALSHTSALLMRPGQQIWGVDLSKVHVTRLDGRSGSVERDVVHHQGPVSEDDVELVDGLPLLREARCVVEAVALGNVESGLCVADSALHQGRVTREELLELHERNRWRFGARTVDLVTRLTEAGAESVGESRSRFMFWSQGFPKPIVQYPVFDSDGTLVGTTDLGWPWLGLLYEFDGRIKYGRLLKPGELPGDAVFNEKLREDAIRRASRCAVERGTWVDLSHPAATVRRARARISRTAS